MYNTIKEMLLEQQQKCSEQQSIYDNPYLIPAIEQYLAMENLVIHSDVKTDFEEDNISEKSIIKFLKFVKYQGMKIFKYQNRNASYIKQFVLYNQKHKIKC